MIATIILGIFTLLVMTLFLKWLGINPFILLGSVIIIGLVYLALWLNTSEFPYGIFVGAAITLFAIVYSIKVWRDPAYKSLTSSEKWRILNGQDPFK
ncbi:Uncharacterised protein [Phocoenobacter uteri]|uniref:Uncharacterized protein n=1 Tax=Phocoenobacter uteri TaxID=146806 RepID=A0A379C9K0_9PAST|nr:hypothetical protein [Phocoenobacter uteri]MDG6882777.1 hypothetical protein [Phocoenobacter uteri]SUB58944.1 Uncharacterised protein [Phocoenobacter uteri]SUB76445.1 Uncharacterised protein [Phocoenobacter uteri]